MSKADNEFDNKPDPRACPQCHKFPCSCPGAGGGGGSSDDENISHDKTDAIKDKSNVSSDQKIDETHTNDGLGAIFQGDHNEVELFSAPSAKPVLKLDEELVRRHSRQVGCEFFTLPANNVTPMNASGNLRFDNASSCVPGMKMSGSDE